MLPLWLLLPSLQPTSGQSWLLQGGFTGYQGHISSYNISSYIISSYIISSYPHLVSLDWCRSGGGAAQAGGGDPEAAGARQLLRRGQLVRGPGARHQHLAPAGGGVWNSKYYPSINNINITYSVFISSCSEYRAAGP